MGSLCMDIVDHELKRHGQWREDLARRKRAAPDAEFQQARATMARLVKKQNQLLRGTLSGGGGDGEFHGSGCSC